MKKVFSLKTICLLLIAVLLVGSLAACGSKGGSEAVGTYKGQYTKFVGDGDDAKVTDETFSLELKSGGKGTHYRDELEINVTWKLDGENFTMTETFLGSTIEYTGTLKDGKLDIFNGDPADDFTCEYVYEKE